MLSGTYIAVDTHSFQNDMVSFKDKDDVPTALIHMGYLGYDSRKGMAFIPNEEIHQEFIKVIKRKK